MNRIGVFKLEEVLPFVVSRKKDKNAEKEYMGYKVKMYSQRYRLFKLKGVKCISCGIEGKFFALEKPHTEKKRYHFNLYGKNKDGHEVLMTKDHIRPKSKGGKNNLSNYQVMCAECNTKKKDKYEDGIYVCRDCNKELGEVIKVQIKPTRCSFCDSERIDIRHPCYLKGKKMKKKIVNETDLLMKDNHSLGCNLENYADVLRYRGFEREAEDLDRVASRIK